MPSAHPDLDLIADCERCFGLCCVVLPFRAVDGFGADKAGGEACGHLDAHDRCGIHDRLTASGWAGCAAFDCLGAGQHVSQVTYAGVSWREYDNRAEMSAVLSVVMTLHRLLARLGPDDPAYAELLAARDGGPEDLLALDLEALSQRGRRQTTTD